MERGIKIVRRTGPACALLLLALSQAAVAQETAGWSAQIGVQHSDNIERTRTNEESETVGIAGVSFRVDSDRPRLDANIIGALQYRDYLDNSFDSEVVGGVNGLVSYTFIPERFSWMVQDNFGQIADDRQAVETPDNRQNVNYFTTGPDITLPLGDVTALRVSGRFSDAYYETTLEDNQSLNGSLALIRRMSDTTSWSLNGSVTKIQYDQDQIFADNEVREAFVRLETRGSRTTFSGDFGYTEVEQGGEKSDGLLARIQLSREVTRRSRLALEVGTEFASSADAFRRDQSFIGLVEGNEDTIAAGDAFQSDYAYVRWTTDWDRGALGVELTARSEDHETQTALDRDVYGGIVNLSRQMTRRLDIELFGGYANEEFSETAFEFDEWSVGTGLRLRLGERISLRLRVDHYEGSSNNGTRDYEENRGYFGVEYSRGSVENPRSS